MTFRSTSQIVVMRTSLSLPQPWMCSLPRPLTPQTATRSVSLGPAGLASPSSSLPGSSARARRRDRGEAGRQRGGVLEEMAASGRAHGMIPSRG